MQSDISIKIIGVGGGGIHAADLLVDKVSNAVCVAMDTDEAALMSVKSHEKILLGKTVTRHSSAGGDTSLAAKVLNSDIDTIKNCVNACDIVFITASLGGATGSVIAPAIAKLARESGALVFAFCTSPFEFEGAQKKKTADIAFKQMQDICNMAAITPNDAMLASSQSNIKQAFADANKCSVCAITSICAMLSKTGLINIDFGALKNLFKAQTQKSTLFTYANLESLQDCKALIEKLKKFPTMQTPEHAQKASKLIICAAADHDTQMAHLKAALAAIAENFSDSSEVLFGAILDDAYKGNNEVFALGIANEPTVKPETKPVLELPSKAEETASAQLRREKVACPKNVVENKNSQSEFEFVDVELKRGFFDDTEPNLYGKEDLDVPTFMRKKIKIPLKKL